MDIIEFIKFTKQYKYKFINYCEVLIDPKGYIIITNPSHVLTAITYIATHNNKTIEEVRNEVPIEYSPLHWYIYKYGLMSVWYDYCLHSTYKKCPTKFQKRSLNLLIRKGLVSNNITITRAYEYTLYLKRKSMEIEK